MEQPHNILFRLTDRTVRQTRNRKGQKWAEVTAMAEKETTFHSVHLDGVKLKNLKCTYIPSITITRIIWEIVHFNQLKINGNYETQSADKYNLKILAAFFQWLKWFTLQLDLKILLN